MTTGAAGRGAAVQGVAECLWRLGTLRRQTGCYVLMYHRIGRQGDPFPHVDVDAFHRQMRWVKDSCQVIAPPSLDAAGGVRWSMRPPVLVTFDDGGRDYADLAYPVLRELNIPAIVFLVTDYVDRPRLFWWERLHLAVTHARMRRLFLPWLPAGGLDLEPTTHDRVIAACEAHLKSLRDELKERALDDIVSALGDPDLPDVGRQTMTWDEVRSTMDCTTFGGHTHTHPLLSRIDDERLDDEIRVCRNRMTAETGVAPTLFAYPNGDVTPAAKRLLPKHGFLRAFSTREGLAHQASDRLETPRTAVAGGLPTRRMIAPAWI